MIVARTSRLLFLALLLPALNACVRGEARPVTPEPLERIELAEDLYLRQIGEGAYVITHSYPWPANSLLVEMADGALVLAGTPYTPEAARLVLDWAAGEFGERRIVAINTGYHADNLGGNRALLEAGIPVYGSDLTVRLLAERGEQTRQLMLEMIADTRSPFYRAYQEMEFVPPDRVFAIADGLTLSFGGEQVQIIYPGPTQAPDKVAVYFPSRRLLFGSCMILSGEAPGNIAEADLARWPEAVRLLGGFPLDVVVPGHGEWLDPGLIQHTLDLLAAAGK